MLGLVYRIDLITLAVLLFVALVTAKEIGYQIARRRVRGAPLPDDVRSGVGFAVTGMLGLMAFTLGLTISMAQDRFDARRALMLTEANAIGTAYLRAQAIGGHDGATIAGLLPDYTRLRIRYLDDSAATETAALYARAGLLQQQIWAAASEIARRDSSPVTALLLQALNDVFDQSLAIRYAYESRVPLSIVRLLLVAALLSVGCMGYFFGLAGARQTAVSGLLILLWVLCFALIVDLDRPRRGTVRVEPAALIWTLESFAPVR